MGKDTHIKMGDIEIPEDYFQMNVIEKEVVCIAIMNNILELIDKEFHPAFNRMILLDKLLESSIITNTEKEEYEVAQVLTDIRKIVNG